MGLTGTATGLGFIAARVLGNEVGRLFPWALGVTFVVAVIAAIKVAPKRHRQAMAR